MTFSKNTRRALSRIVDYAHKTKIKFESAPQSQKLKGSCLPDTRGFSPHRRVVHLGTLKKSDLWVMHDLLHILFYDYAAKYLPSDQWKNKNRFFEIHLASEAFAVLLLDYHLLSLEPKGGLAVDLKKGHFEKFKKINPQLPHFLSAEFCKALIDLYLKGDFGPLAVPKDGHVSSAAYVKWLGHEVRYSEKQRLYTQMWWNDLQLKKSKNTGFVLTSSRVHHAVWDLIFLLLHSDNTQWNQWVRQIKPIKNTFAHYPKFKKGLDPRNVDFRFTRITSISKSKVLSLLENVNSPNPSDLYLFWQCLGPVEKSLSHSERKSLKSLTLDSQKTKKIPLENWRSVQKLALKYYKKAKHIQSPESMGDFFLP